MERDVALNFLIANAICTTSNGDLTCEDCPLYESEFGSCTTPTEEQLSEAVRTIQEAHDGQA